MNMHGLASNSDKPVKKSTGGAVQKVIFSSSIILQKSNYRGLTLVHKCPKGLHKKLI